MLEIFQNADETKGESTMPAPPLKSRSNPSKNKYLIPGLICLALAVITAIAFRPVKDCGFINFDDDMYVYENESVQAGLSVHSIGQAFSLDLVKKSGNWHPLTWLSLMFDYTIFGLNPFGYHLVNLLFHLINSMLLFLVLQRMTKNLWPSAFVAALFAIHPLHVESVAWIAERKDVLSTFFLMLSLGAYSYYVEHRNFRRYFPVLIFFTLGLMAKSMLVTLPFVLLLLDFWPLHRLQVIKPERQIKPAISNSAIFAKSKKKSKKEEATKAIPEIKKTSDVKKPAGSEYKRSSIYPVLREKIPFFILCILSSIVTYLAQQTGGSVKSFEILSPAVRVGNAFVSYMEYMGKMIWPSHLAFYYPHPGVLPFWQILGAALLLLAVTVIVIRYAMRFPYLVMGWLWYLGTLVPVIGIVQVGAQGMADRYTYITLIGLFIILTWGAADLVKNWRYRKEILFVLSALIVSSLTVITWVQVRYWQNSITLCDHTLHVTDNNWPIYTILGNAYNNLGNYRQAITNYDSAIRIKPDYAEAYIDRSAAFTALGNYRQAIEDLNRAMGIKPDYAAAYVNRSIASNGLGNYGQAVADSGRAIELKPGYAAAYTSRGIAYNGLGHYERAIAEFNMAIDIKPRYAEAYRNRSVSYFRLGDESRALNDLKTAAGYGDERAKNFLRIKGISW